MSIEQVRSKTFLVSTDSTGFFGRPMHWKKAWEFAWQDSAFGGYEAIAWGGQMTAWTDYLLENAKELGCNVVGLHGRTGGIHETYGGFDRVILGTLNRFILPTPDLIKRAPSVDYILIHGPELRNESYHRLLREKTSQVKLLYVENHLRPGADGQALSVAQDLRMAGVNAGVMFDLFHDFMHRRLNGDIASSWNKTLFKLRQVLEQKDFEGQAIPVGIHVPVGTKVGDSLPFDAMTPSMWQNLGSLMQTRKDIRVVIENQQTGLGNVMPIQLASQVDRNRRIVDVLRSANII